MSPNTARPERVQGNTEMTLKSFALSLQDAGWLMIVLLLCAAVFATASVLGRPGGRELRRIVLR